MPTKFEIFTILESIQKIENYSQDYSTADEIWDIIKNNLLPLKAKLIELSK